MSKFLKTAWFLSGALVLAFLLTSCLKQDNILGGPLNNGSSAEVKFNGKTHKVDGLGLANFVDTLIYSINNDVREFNLLGLSVIEYNKGFLASKYFSILIYNYDGPGKYTSVYLDDEVGESGVAGITMFENVGSGTDFTFASYSFEELEVVIDRDNNTQISGTFSGVGEDEETGVAGPFSGKFKVIK
jgi:hypothetical protein